MPDVRNCRRCGKIYNYIGGPPICPSCKDLDEEDFKRVKEYLYEHPGASMSQISNDLEISTEKIKRFLKDGRLEIVGDEGNMILECENCGKAIKSGRFCESCERDLAKGFKNAASSMNDSLSQSQDNSKAGGLKYLHKEIKK